MSQLTRIKDDLDRARSLVRRAGKRAKDARDNSGHQECEKVAEKIDKVYDNFSGKGEDRE